MKTNDPRFIKGKSDKSWFKKGHKLSPESIEKMRKAKTKYSPEEREIRKKERDFTPKRKIWKDAYAKRPSRKYGIYKDSARKKGLVFNLSFEEFMQLWQKSCSYCQEEIETIGIDRLDNDIGYTSSNLISCCKVCNYMKRELSFQDFLNRCEKIFKMHNSFLF